MTLSYPSTFASSKDLSLDMDVTDDRSMEGPHSADDASGTQMVISQVDSRSRQTRKRDRSGENFKKRWRTLVRTLSKLHYDCGTEFHVSLSRKGQGDVCRSRKGISPLLADETVQVSLPFQCPHCTLIITRACASFRKS